jgi:hypothetical protein
LLACRRFAGRAIVLRKRHNIPWYKHGKDDQQSNKLIKNVAIHFDAAFRIEENNFYLVL